MSKAVVSFNGLDFENSVPGLRIVITDPYRAPNRTVTTNKIARTNKSVTSSAFFNDKKINITVEIGVNTRELMDVAIDQFKAILQAKEATLITTYGTVTRQYTATMDNFSITGVAGGHSTIDVEFECADPYGYDTALTTLVTGAQTGASRTDNVTFGGTAEKQQPVITITLTKVVPGSNHGITITNPATGQAIVINRVTGWAAADVLIIDTAQKLITLNGSVIAFTGPIPEWDLGAGQIQYADTFTSRTFSIGVAYRKRYL